MDCFQDDDSQCIFVACRWTAPYCALGISGSPYRSTNDLHLVDSGHDSPWVAGQALSTERPLFKDLGSDWESWFHSHVAPAELPVAQRFQSSSIHRWKSVIAIPIRVQYQHWPVFATAVLSIGLPQKAGFYQRTHNDWSLLVTTLANKWSDRLSAIIK